MLSSAAENKGLGVIVENLPDKPYLKGMKLLSVAALPSAFDWRNHNGRNFISSVKYQGSCGSCFAFATVAALESKLSIGEKPGLDLSEQIVLSLSGAGDCSGGFISRASEFLKNVGDTIESCWPYQAAYDPARNACEGWEENSYRFYKWNWVYPVNDSATLKRIIYFQGPAVVIFKAFTDLYSYKGGIYTHKYGEFEGYHAVLLVGWDDTIGAFIAKNSWGKNWGESGFIKVAYSEVTSGTEFGFQTFFYGDAYFAGQVEPGSSDGDVYLTGEDTGVSSDGGGCFIATAADT
jgi:C1A family cysteine protease